jgi:FkbM family methyltransferase
MNFLKYKYTEKGRRVIWVHFITLILKNVFNKSTSLFLRTGDIISYRPLIEGVHEPHIKELFETLSRKGFCNFFIDIGANIGLSSTLVADKFESLFLFEPNPIVFKVLEANVLLTAYKDRFTLFNYGLGNKHDSFELMVPRHNFGGAFIVSEENSYNKDILSSKDGFSQIKKDNYVSLSVDIRQTKEELGNIFSLLRNKGASKGVIKIDVEGFEEVVLKDIAAILPEDLSVFIIFENWDKDFDFTRLINSFGRKANLYYIKNTGCRFGSKFLKTTCLFFGGKFKYSLESIKKGMKVKGDIVIEVVK